MNIRIRASLAASAVALSLVGTTSPAGALPAYTTEPTSYTNNRLQGQPMVVGLRVSEHAHFDRVVIDVDGRRPGYRVRYLPRLSYDGSGADVPLKGRKRLSIALFPARAHDLAGHNVYAGPQLQQFTLPMLRGVAFTGDFEGVVSFGLTARAKHGYRIFTLNDPSRIVIDLKH